MHADQLLIVGVDSCSHQSNRESLHFRAISQQISARGAEGTSEDFGKRILFFTMVRRTLVLPGVQDAFYSGTVSPFAIAEAGN